MAAKSNNEAIANETSDVEVEIIPPVEKKEKKSGRTKAADLTPAQKKARKANLGRSIVLKRRTAGTPNEIKTFPISNGNGVLIGHLAVKYVAGKDAEVSQTLVRTLGTSMSNHIAENHPKWMRVANLDTAPVLDDAILRIIRNQVELEVRSAKLRGGMSSSDAAKHVAAMSTEDVVAYVEGEDGSVKLKGLLAMASTEEA